MCGVEVSNFGIEVHHFNISNIPKKKHKLELSQFNRNHYGYGTTDVVTIDVRIEGVCWRARALVGEW